MTGTEEEYIIGISKPGLYRRTKCSLTCFRNFANLFSKLGSKPAVRRVSVFVTLKECSRKCYNT